MIIRQLFLLLTCLLLPIGCATKLYGPRLGEIYNRVAKHHDEHRNPVIVIPGILGSKLVEHLTGQIAWGAFTEPMPIHLPELEQD